MTSWTLADIPWDRFDPAKVDRDLVPIVKAASMVEYNADDYRQYLKRVFKDDEKVCRAIDGWSVEEVQHGRALAVWARLADPGFDFDSSFRLFRESFRVPVDVDHSVRGSRSGEMVARCMVETGTNSFYSALSDATDEPVLKEICRRIADDEYAHYCLFLSQMRRSLQTEDLTVGQRLRIAFGRIAEAEDEELATAYWAANRPREPFDRRANSVAYARESLKYYRSGHIGRMVEMVFRAIGLDPSGPLGWFAARAARLFIWYRSRFQPRLAVLRSGLAARLAPPGYGGRHTGAAG